MTITEKEVLHVARLARLRLTPQELALYREQLGRVLEHIEELSRLDTGSVPPTAHVLGLVNALRPDEPAPWPGREALLAQAPASEGPYFKVPKVIE